VLTEKPDEAAVLGLDTSEIPVVMSLRPAPPGR
jgi:hypothetical protein